MSTALATRCPAWCTDHVHLDGNTVSHVHEVSADLRETWIAVEKETDYPEPFISVEVQGGNRWTATEAMRLIAALVRAIWILDPDLENPAEHDTSGLWLAAGKAIRARMADAGLSQTELGPMIGMSQPELSILSRGAGIRTFSLNELDAIAEVLGCTLSGLVAEIEATR